MMEKGRGGNCEERNAGGTSSFLAFSTYLSHLIICFSEHQEM